MLKIARILTARPKPPEGIYLNVPYKDKDAAKAIGGVDFDGVAKKWWCYPKDLQALARWANPEDLAKAPAAPAAPVVPAPEWVPDYCPECMGRGKDPYYGGTCRKCNGGQYYTNKVIFLQVPPEEMDAVKALGAKQDFQSKWWFVSDTPSNIQKFRKWISPETLAQAHAAEEATRQEAEATRQRDEASTLRRKQDAETRDQEAKLAEKTRLQPFFITEEEARARGLTIGTEMYGRDLPQFFPGNEKFPPHIHDMQGGTSRRGYSAYRCSICGATTESDSSD